MSLDSWVICAVVIFCAVALREEMRLSLAALREDLEIQLEHLIGDDNEE